MNKINEGGAAFPGAMHADHKGIIHSCEHGMTLRDYFAAKALPVAFSAMESGYFESDENMALEIAICSYQMADAMLAARHATGADNG